MFVDPSHGILKAGPLASGEHHVPAMLFTQKGEEAESVVGDGEKDETQLRVTSAMQSAERRFTVLVRAAAFWYAVRIKTKPKKSGGMLCV